MAALLLLEDGEAISEAEALRTQAALLGQAVRAAIRTGIRASLHRDSKETETAEAAMEEATMTTSRTTGEPVVATRLTRASSRAAQALTRGPILVSVERLIWLDNNNVWLNVYNVCF